MEMSKRQSLKIFERSLKKTSKRIIKETIQNYF